MTLPAPKKAHKANVPNPKDSNTRGKKLVKAQHAGAVGKGSANRKVHEVHGTMGKGPKKTASMHVKKK